MWPVHCVQESEGSMFHKELVTEESDIVIRKADTRDNESYSGFGAEENPTSLLD